MPPLETDIAVETEEIERIETNIIQNLKTLCAMIKRVMSERLESIRELRELTEMCKLDCPQNEITEVNAKQDKMPPNSEKKGKEIKISKEEKKKDLEGRSRRYNLRIIGLPETEDKANEAETIIKELLEENFPELKKEQDLQVETAHRVPLKFNEKKATPRHILVTFLNLKDKDKILQASRERKQVTYKGTKIRLTSDFSLATLNARRQWNNIYRILKENNFEPRIIYPAKLSFLYEGNCKTFSDMQGLRKYINQEPSLKSLLYDLLQPKENQN
ncbi:type 2 phosphatidylinositol 4,5-bisphosphate 4-phosphatase isoform X1 [Nycticebus coucang]|uniref:type 2 phosphatidylinositol 4,5-bisphosphate 4-phosphatase isoform X1 n=1 Tax=Nycticebus coucang TaxID=9470 RepID=UPI00234D1C7A|nr:type 2 phosphatidylinositol 4,5-bisphosphate 4-phosphatase isoform X1 [Nycticebus coucang]